MKLPKLRRKYIVAAAVLAVTFVFCAGHAQAVTYGVPDGERHPYVGLMVFESIEIPGYRCSGMLLSPTVMLTSGICTFEALSGRVWFESDVEAGIPDNGYPYGGGTSIEFAEIHTHPDFESDPFMNNVGVVILSEPVDIAEYGVLAPIGFLDGLVTKRGLKAQVFDIVGYGYQSYLPEELTDRIRYTGEVMLIGVNGTVEPPEETWALFTNTPSNRASGGGCFGDAGGPFLYGGTNMIAAVIFSGVSDACKGIDIGYRVDTFDVHEFINQFLND